MSKVIQMGVGEHDNAQVFLHELAELAKPNFAVIVYVFDPSDERLPMMSADVNATQAHFALTGAECLKIAALDTYDEDE